MNTLVLAAFAFLFGFAAVLSAHRYQSWLAPAPIWNLCWCVLFLATSILGYGFFYPSVPVSALVLLAALYNIPGFLLGSAIERPAEADDPALVAALTPPSWLLGAAAVVGFVGAVRLGLDLGMSVFALRSIDDLMNLGQQNAVAIFRGEANFSFLVNLAFAVVQLGTALGGVRLALRPARSAVLAVGALFAVALLWSSITTQRSYLLVPIVWFGAGYLATMVWRGRRTMPSRSVLIAVILGSVTLLLVVFLRAVRTSGTRAGFSEATFAPTRLWLAGYVPTFGAWLEQAESTGPDFGLLNGVVALVQPFFGGAADNAVESDYYSVGGGLTSNAGTAMMRIVGTGGLMWGALMVVFLGTVAHLVYRRAAQGGPVAAASYVGVVAATLWSTNAWFLGYGARVLALILLILFAVAAQRLAVRPQIKDVPMHADRPRRTRTLLRT